MKSPVAFAGRVIFDHLAKTAGQSVNKWLRDSLGAGCVTENLIGTHRALIKAYGGDYSIISGHVDFEYTLLDPRYKYITCLRDPIERLNSWIHFVINDHPETNLSWNNSVSRFYESEGDFFDEQHPPFIKNYYVSHFSKICEFNLKEDQKKLEYSIDVCMEYDIVGFFDRIPDFIENIAELASIKYSEIPHINKTSNKPTLFEMSKKLSDNIKRENELDIEFYNKIKHLKYVNKKFEYSHGTHFRSLSANNFNSIRIMLVDERIRVSAEQIDFGVIKSGEIINFSLEYSLQDPVDNICVGIRLIDSHGNWVFGTNTKILNQKVASIGSGTFEIQISFVADLPDGDYFIWADFEAEEPDTRQLAVCQNICLFRIARPRMNGWVGTTFIPTQFLFSKISETVAARAVDSASTGAGEHVTPVVWRFDGLDQDRLFTLAGERKGAEIATTGKAGYLMYGPYLALKAGRYRARIEGVGTHATGQSTVDVLPDPKQPAIALYPLADTPFGGSGCLAEVRFTLEQDVSLLELRVVVTEAAVLAIHALVIERETEELAASAAAPGSVPGSA